MRITARPYLSSILLLTLFLLLSVGVGSVFIPPQTLIHLITRQLSNQPVQPDLLPFSTILFELRIPRTILIALTGAALAGSGASYQGLFRNPLADPYLIGVASGAGLGAILAMSIRWPYTTLGLLAVPLAAFISALLTVFLVYQIARVGKTVPTTNLILAGVAVSALTSAVTSFLMITSTNELYRAVAWLLGGSTITGWRAIWVVLPYIALGLAIQIAMGHAMNVLQFGDEQAEQLGLSVSKARWLIILAASLTTASAVSFSGIIGFVGLIVPHVVRLIWGGDYRRLIPLSVLNGASLLLIADVLARVILSPQELPVGIITAIGGAPFFLWLLKRAKQENYW